MIVRARGTDLVLMLPNPFQLRRNQGPESDRWSTWNGFGPLQCQIRSAFDEWSHCSLGPNLVLIGARLGRGRFIWNSECSCPNVTVGARGSDLLLMLPNSIQLHRNEGSESDAWNTRNGFGLCIAKSVPHSIGGRTAR